MHINSLSKRMIRKPITRFVAALAVVAGLSACDDTLGPVSYTHLKLKF